MRRSTVHVFPRLALRQGQQTSALCLFSNGSRTAVSSETNMASIARNYAAPAKGGKGAPAAAKPAEDEPAEPLKLETVTFPDFGEDKPFNADISDFPAPKDWKYVSDWKQFEFSPRVRKIGEALFQLNQVEMFELVKLLQLRFDVPDSALMGGGVVVQAAGAAAPAAAAEPAAEEPKEEKKEKMIFDVQLTAVAEADKFKVLKEIRALKPGMKLLESKEMVEKLPSMLKQNVPKEEAEQMVAKFKELGGTVELK